MAKHPNEYFDYNDRGLVKINQSFFWMNLIKRVKTKLFWLIWLSFLCFSVQIFSSCFTMPPLIFDETTKAWNVGCDRVASPLRVNVGLNHPNPSLISDGTMYCDRNHFRTDVCLMKGDIRTHSSSSSIFLYNTMHSNKSLDLTPSSIQKSDDLQDLQHEVIKPYTRKWETSIMRTIDQLHLISKHKQPLNSLHKCDILHDVPTIIFSTGGYTGNVYHEFNDGVIPLYISSHHLNRKVIFVILEYHDWWYKKYEKIISQLSDYPLINFKFDPRTHCFREATIGLKIHNELTIDPSLMLGNKTMVDLRNLLGRAYDPIVPSPLLMKPKLVMLSRKGTRSITNEKYLVKLAQKVGFHVQVLKPNRNSKLDDIYREISTSDVMIGVHGAAMTHFLFLKPTSILIQIIPLGTEWPSETYYGEPAKKFGLNYIGYKILPKESSLYKKYDKNDPIMRDPNSVNKKGWDYTKKIYLDDQKVTLDLKRFQTLLIDAYEDYIVKSHKIVRKLEY